MAHLPRTVFLLLLLTVGHNVSATQQKNAVETLLRHLEAPETKQDMMKAKIQNLLEPFQARSGSQNGAFVSHTNGIVKNPLAAETSSAEATAALEELKRNITKELALSPPTNEVFVVTDIDPGVEISGLSSSTLFEAFYFGFTAPLAAGDIVTCETRGNNGDTDLYLSFDAPAFDPGNVFGCYSGSFTSMERCSATAFSNNTSLFIELFTFEEYFDLSLLCYFGSPPIAENFTLVPGVPLENQAAPNGGILVYDLTVPFDAEETVYCTCESLVGNAHLFVRIAGPVLEGDSDCVQLGPTSNEYCALQANETNTNVSVGVLAGSAFVNLTVQCTFGLPPGPPEEPIDDNVPMAGLSTPAGGALYYEFATPLVVGDTLTCQTSGDNGNLGLYLYQNGLPLNGSIICSANAYNSPNEICFITAANEGILTITVYSWEITSEFSLDCGFGTVDFTRIKESKPLIGQSAPLGASLFYQLDATFKPGGQVTCELAGDNGDADLFVYFGNTFFPPPDSQFGCRRALRDASYELCTATSFGFFSDITVIVVAEEAFTDLTIECYLGSRRSIPLFNGIAVDDISADVNQDVFLSFREPLLAGQSIACRTSGLNGDVTMLVAFDGWFEEPSSTLACFGANFSSPNTECAVEALYNTKVFVTIIPFKAFTDLSVECLKTETPTLAPTNTPSPPADGCGCFAGHTLVHVRGKGMISMHDLNIGDYVLTSTGAQISQARYEPVYGFGHYHKTALTSYIQIFYAEVPNHSNSSTLSEPLEVTANHLIYLDGKLHPVRADAVKVNDRLVSSREQELLVTDISTVTRQGAFAPLTPSGTILVHDANIVASVYVSLQNTPSEYIELGWKHPLPLLPQHSLCHMWLAPYRMYCMLSDSYCQHEAYTTRGRSSWVHTGKEFLTWGEQLPLVIQFFVLGVVCVVLAVAMAIESKLLVGITTWNMALTAATVFACQRWTTYYSCSHERRP